MLTLYNHVSRSADVSAHPVPPSLPRLPLALLCSQRKTNYLMQPKIGYEMFLGYRKDGRVGYVARGGPAPIGEQKG